MEELNQIITLLDSAHSYIGQAKQPDIDNPTRLVKLQLAQVAIQTAMMEANTCRRKEQIAAFEKKLWNSMGVVV